MDKDEQSTFVIFVLLYSDTDFMHFYCIFCIFCTLTVELTLLFYFQHTFISLSPEFVICADVLFLHCAATADLYQCPCDCFTVIQ